MFCMNCGNRIIEGAKFCAICGKAAYVPPSDYSKFYVFIADAGNGQRSSFGMELGMMYGNMFGSGDPAQEANKLKNRYESGAQMELVMVQHSQWSPVLTAKSIGSGMSTVDFDLKKSLHSIEKYLKGAGYSKEQIKTATDICTEKNLTSSDSTVARFFVGIPI